MTQLNRRGFLQGATAGLAAGATTFAHAVSAQPLEKKYQEGISPWPLSLNTSTIRPASLMDKINITAETGWDAIEPWIDDLEKHEKDGGNLKDLGKLIADKGLFVTNVIGLWDCLPATQKAFDASLEATRRRMRMASDIGSRYVAAIPAPDREDFDLKWGAEKYGELLKIGLEDYNITVAFEFIGFFKSVNRLGTASAVALDAKHPNACLIADTFHLYRGGSDFEGLKHLQGNFIANFHWNDIPDTPPREETGDKDRVFPGDGILPLEQALRDLRDIGFTRTLSLETFNREHWAQDPKVVAETGLRKMVENIVRAEL